MISDINFESLQLCSNIQERHKALNADFGRASVRPQCHTLAVYIGNMLAMAQHSAYTMNRKLQPYT